MRDVTVKLMTKMQNRRGWERYGLMNNVVHNIQIYRDLVLIRQEKANKLSTPLNPNPFIVVWRRGNSLIVRGQGGVEYSQNITHVRKYHRNYDIATSEDDAAIPNDISVNNTGLKDNDTLPTETVLVNSYDMPTGGEETEIPTNMDITERPMHGHSSSS